MIFSSIIGAIMWTFWNSFPGLIIKYGKILINLIFG